MQVDGSAAVFNHAGDGILLVHNFAHAICVIDFPILTICEFSGGMMQVGILAHRYLTSGGLV